MIVGEDEDARQVTRIMLMGRKLPSQIGQFFNLVGFVYKSAKGDQVRYRVLFEGRSDLDTKGMPGLRRREEPDIEYWYRRAILGEKPRDEDAKMIPEVSRTWGESSQNQGGDSDNNEKKNGRNGKNKKGAKK